MKVSEVVHVIKSLQFQSAGVHGPRKNISRMEHPVRVEMNLIRTPDREADVKGAPFAQHSNNIFEAQQMALGINIIPIPAKTKMFDGVQTRN